MQCYGFIGLKHTITHNAALFLTLSGRSSKGNMAAGVLTGVRQVLRGPRLVSAVFSCHGQTFSSAAAAPDTGETVNDIMMKRLLHMRTEYIKPSDLEI